MPLSIAFVDNKLTTCIELPEIENIKYLHERYNWNVEFVPSTIIDVVEKMCDFFTRAFFQLNCIYDQKKLFDPAEYECMFLN